MLSQSESGLSQTRSSQMLGDSGIIAAPNPELSAPPCFFWAWCAQRSAIEKAGRSVCRHCAPLLRGFEYPLRFPEADVQEPAYTLPVEDIELIER